MRAVWEVLAADRRRFTCPLQWASRMSIVFARNPRERLGI